ncbi:MAG: ABC-F family ATP-binding cassette domain-containing protein [Brooklawnia sp.]|uniref:ABC-F family ATP-binding cassette domain-containing protein n=1 Tax=Brooklawnia sp. TaxID=2699740 RepID=UPI003C765834
MASGAPNLINAEGLTKGYGTRILLDDVSLGLAVGDVIGVVGRNGDGKSTLLGLLTGQVEPDAGRVTRTGGISVAVLEQAEKAVGEQTVRDLALGGVADHVWAADARQRRIVAHLLAGIELDAAAASLSGGERRRVALVGLLTGRHDLLVLDEPTNHLDVEAVDWLAQHLRELQDRGVAMLVVSHDRWFLDAICTRIWEVHDGVVDDYDGGYAAYVLARAERSRQAAANEQRRRNLVRKELAWLRRGGPARTSKPKFRIEAANELIADEPEPRDRLELAKFASARLGKDVIDLTDASVVLPDGRALLNRITWSIGPGDRIGLVGVNGSGKSTLLRLLAGEQRPTSGQVKHGQTLRLAHLSQHVTELDDDDRVLASVNRLRAETKLATGRDASAVNLLEDFGFTGDRLVTRIGELSGGERRRLQLLRLLLGEPNVLLLDEPTNDLDIDTLTVIEDYLDSWPGTLVVASHDRYFMERVCDVQYALRSDGSCVLLPGGIDQYLAERAAEQDERPPAQPTQPTQPKVSDAARSRAARKELARLESQLDKTARAVDRLHLRMAESASDYTRLAELQVELDAAEARQVELEEAWLLAAEDAEG